MERAGAKGRPLSILPTLAAAFGWSYSYTTLLNVVISVLQFASPQIVSLLIDFVTSDEPAWKGYFYTVLIVAVTLLTTFLNTLAFYQEYLVGLRVRSALISAIYRVVRLDVTPEIEICYMLFDRSLSIFSRTSLKQHMLQFPVLNPIGPPFTESH